MNQQNPKNWKPREVITFLVKNGFLLKRTHGDHAILHNPHTKHMTLVDQGRNSFCSQEIKTIAKQSGIPRDKWIR